MDRKPQTTLSGRSCTKSRLRAQVQIPSDLPILQIEIEVIAALLDDLSLESLNVAEAAE